MRVAIPTKDNHASLCGCLWALRTAMNSSFVEVSICDASGQPAMTVPAISRILATFEVVHYRHVLADGPGEQISVSEQRVLAGSAYSADSYVVWLDDDVMPQAGWIDALSSLEQESHQFVQGVKVDRFNDRGYKDYCVLSTEVSNHTFCKDIMPFTSLAGFVDKSRLVADIRGDTGLFITTPDFLESVTKRVLASNPPNGVCDDTVAQWCYLNADFVLHESLVAWHIGNSNNVWNHQEYKKFAVDQTLKHL